MSVTTIVANLKAGDHIRRPDGGKSWVKVARVIGTDPVELMLIVGGGVTYKSLPSSRPVVRQERDGEAAG